MFVRAVVAAALLALSAAAPARAASWRWPVRGPVLERFAYGASTPFARGQRRGIEIGGAPGTAVRAACAGRVSFAGSVPRYGGGATVVCGALAVSYLRLASVSVRRGHAVAAGDRLGALGPGGLHFGVRRAGRRWAYLDPLALLGDGDRVRPVPVVPGGRWRAGPRPFRSAPRPGPARAPLPVSVPAAHPAPAVPLVAWLGLGLLAAALPAFGAGRVRRRRRSAWAPRPAPAGRRQPAR